MTGCLLGTSKALLFCSKIELFQYLQSAETVNNITAKSKEKRPRSAYAIFQAEMGPQILANYQGLGIGEGSKKIAAEWKKVSEEEKAR